MRDRVLDDLAGGPSCEKHLLRLYVTGQTPRSQRAIASVTELCDEMLRDHYELAVIDLFEHRNAGEWGHIVAAPTLVRVSPPPVRRLTGDLTDRERLLTILDLKR